MTEMEQPTYCARHSWNETRLGCSQCGTLICPQCLVQTPVGAKCPDCANLRGLPTFELGIVTLARAAGAGVLLAVATGSIWGLMFFDLFRIPFLPWIAVVGIGYLIGEGISVSTNRRRGKYLQYIAGGGVVLSYVVAGFVSPLVFVFTIPNIFFLLMLGVGAYIAASRVR